MKLPIEAKTRWLPCPKCGGLDYIDKLTYLPGNSYVVNDIETHVKGTIALSCGRCGYQYQRVSTWDDPS